VLEIGGKQRLRICLFPSLVEVLRVKKNKLGSVTTLHCSSSWAVTRKQKSKERLGFSCINRGKIRSVPLHLLVFSNK
jgi:hypothetical protein